MLQKYEGIVIRTSDYGESDKVVVVYSKEAGKIAGMARGAKKTNSRLASSTQPFTNGYYVVHTSRGLGGMRQAEIIQSFRGIREDIFKTAYAAYIVELLDRSTGEKEQNPFLYELVLQTLQYIDEDYDPDIITNIFEMKMLNVLGIYPELQKCVLCGNTEAQFGYSIKENGLLCHQCFEREPYFLRVSQQTIKLLRVFYFFDLNRLGNISVKQTTKDELKRVIDMIYDEYSGLYLKSKKFLKQVDHLREHLPTPERKTPTKNNEEQRLEE